MKETDLRVRKTYKLLIEALLSLLKEMPFEKIKVTDICEKAMVHRTTFYSHFKDKYDLLEYFITELQQDIELKVKEKYHTDNLYDYYLEITRIFLDHISDNQEIYQSILNNNSNSITLDMLYHIFINDLIKKIGEENLDIPAKIVANYYFGAVSFTILDWLRSSSTITKEELYEYLTNLIKK